MNKAISLSQFSKEELALIIAGIVDVINDVWSKDVDRLSSDDQFMYSFGRQIAVHLRYAGIPLHSIFYQTNGQVYADLDKFDDILSRSGLLNQPDFINFWTT